MNSLASERDIGFTFEDFVGPTDFFSGADLVGLFDNAHLKAISDHLKDTPIDAAVLKKKHRFSIISISNNSTWDLTDHLAQLDSTVDANSVESKSKIVLLRSHFDTMLLDTKPSMNVKELQRFERIYHEFVNGKDSNTIGSKAILG